MNAPRKAPSRVFRGARLQGPHGPARLVQVTATSTLTPRPVPSKANAELAEAYAGLILAHRPWNWFVTLTTRAATFEEAFRRRYIELVAATNVRLLGLAAGENLWHADRLRWVCAWERQRRGAWHLHALWSSPRLAQVPFTEVHDLWRWSTPAIRGGRWGRFTTEREDGVDWLVSRDAPPRGDRSRGRQYDFSWLAPVRSSAGAAASYVTKYVSKGGLIDCDGLSAEASGNARTAPAGCRGPSARDYQGRRSTAPG